MPGRHMSIIVNAANMPSGQKAAEVRKQGVRLSFKLCLGATLFGPTI
jgi:hypothetical protein